MTDYYKIKEMIKKADAVIIGAGAGLSTAAGIDYGDKHFKERFPELAERYQMTDMYTSSFYRFETEEERWSYWAKHINYLYNVSATDVYNNLYDLVCDKNYFVITTNVDGQFLKASFDKDKVFEIQGSLSKIQCARLCHNKLYDDLDLVRQMLKEDRDCRIPSRLVPKCPVCGGRIDVNLRMNEFFAEDDHWKMLSDSYDKFISDNKDKRVVLIELGVGFNTPGIIRFPFEMMVRDFKDTFLIRVNERNADLFLDISDKSILIKDDCKNFLENMKKTD